MRAAQSQLPDHRTRAACARRRVGLRSASCLAIVAFCTLLAGCGQRGPLYYPVLPPLNSADTAMPANMPMLQALPSAQSPLMDGTPTTIIAAPPTLLPGAGDSTMPIATRPAPAATPVLTPEQTAPAANGGASSASSSSSSASTSSAAPSTTPAAAGASGQP
jgi:predicted small lipoprotein YifL